jgi:hypothetical protein
MPNSASRTMAKFLSQFLNAFLDFSATGKVTSSPMVAPDESSCFPAAERVVAIGDIHGDVDAARKAFLLAGLIDESGRWTGGTSVCVQVNE